MMKSWHSKAANHDVPGMALYENVIYYF